MTAHQGTANEAKDIGVALGVTLALMLLFSAMYGIMGHSLATPWSKPTVKIIKNIILMSSVLPGVYCLVFMEELKSLKFWILTAVFTAVGYGALGPSLRIGKALGKGFVMAYDFVALKLTFLGLPPF